MNEESINTNNNDTVQSKKRINSYNSAKSNKSIQSIKSNKSNKSIQSIKSNKSTKSTKTSNLKQKSKKQVRKQTHSFPKTKIDDNHDVNNNDINNGDINNGDIVDIVNNTNNTNSIDNVDKIDVESNLCIEKECHDIQTNTITDTNNNTNINTHINTSTNDNKRKRDILILSGGATKGVAQIGALHCLKKHGIIPNIKIITATSAGSMVGLLYCIGYQPLKMYWFLSNLKLDKVKNLNTSNVITKYGLDDGTRFIFVLKELMNAKQYDPDITFKDLYERCEIKFIVTGSCINDKKAYYFSYETYPNMKVLDAVRISIAFPIIFTPFIYDGKIFIDGGVMDNFPIHMFQNEIERVIGIYVSEVRTIVDDIKYIEQYLSNMMECLAEGITQRDTNYHHKCVINIKCAKSGDTPEDVEYMFNEGYAIAKAKIDAGDFM